MRLRIDLAYDGTDFHGWATQPGLRTVQGTLEEALTRAVGIAEAVTTCAGRTDAGVHARAQVVHVDLDPAALVLAAGRNASTPLTTLARRLNGILPAEVRVHRVTEAPPGFDARFSASWRRYAYRIADAPDLVDPLARAQVLARPRTLNLPAMNRAAGALLGEHDFSAFCRRRDGASTVRTLLELVWTRDQAGLAVASVRADAFCHSMVRALVGCLVAVGEGVQDVGWPEQVLRAGRRDPGVTVARARGLTLEEVAYPDDADLAAHAASSRVFRTLKRPARGDRDG